MKLLCSALVLQAVLLQQVSCAGKKAASSDPKVTSQVCAQSSDQWLLATIGLREYSFESCYAAHAGFL